ncbi:MAG: hypothetical protein SPK88_08535 [Synergistales bacterium]|nr:hypothetical protein [Synergistales bacterium]
MNEFNYLSFELTQNEEKQIEKIDEEIDRKIQDLRFDDPQYWVYMEERTSKIFPIVDKARARTIKKYENRPHDLRLLLEKEIQRGEILFNPDLEGEELKAARNKAQNDEIAYILPYLKILKRKSTEDYEAVITCIAKFVGLAEKSKTLELMFSGKAITALTLARGKGEFDPKKKKLKIGDDIEIFTPKNVQKIGVGAAKAFRYILAEFTKKNARNMPKDKIINRIFIDVKDFAEANGVDVNSADAMKNFRRKLRDNLDILLTHKISWKETVKGKKEHFPEMTWISAFKVGGNFIMIEVTQSMAEILTLLPLIYFPRALYSLEDRDFNTDAIGHAMAIHYCQENNVIKGTENKISVLKLLEKTSFPTYEELKEKKNNWERNVKEPFENCLDRLWQCGFLKDYKYCYAGDIEIADEEVRAGTIDSYEKFISLIVKFELNNFDSHEIRLAEITEKKIESIKKFQKKRKTKKKADDNTNDK